MSDITAVTQELTALRLVIREHLLRNGLPEKEIVKKLGQFYGVQVRDHQFRDIVIQGWQYWRNMSPKDWVYYYQQWIKRGRKPTDLIVAGVVVSDHQKNQRKVKRTNADSRGPKDLTVTSTRLPPSEWLSVSSPRLDEVDIEVDTTKLPTVIFLKAQNTVMSGITLPLNRGWAIGLAAFRLANGLPVHLDLPADSLASRQDCYRPVLLPLELRAECSILPLSSPKDALRNRLELLVYFLVNKMTPSSWSKSEDQQLIELVSFTSFMDLLETSPGADSYPAVVSILENVLSSAVRLGSVDLVRKLQKGGANINQPVDPMYHLTHLYRRGYGNIITMTPLQMAVCIGYTELARFLLEQGAETHHLLCGDSIVTVAILYDTANGVDGALMLHLFLPLFDSLTRDQFLRSFTWADLSHYRHALEHILDALWIFEWTSEQYADFLTSAIMHGLPEIVDCILTNNEVDLNTCTIGFRRSSPLNAAARSGDLNLCLKLLWMGASATLAEDLTNDGDQGKPFLTTLQEAVFGGNIAVVRLLLENRSPLNFSLPFGRAPKMNNPKNWTTVPRTALQAALLRDDEDMSMYLLELGAKAIGGEYVMAILQDFNNVRCHLERQGMTFHDKLPNGPTVMEAAITSLPNLDFAFEIMKIHPTSITSAVLVGVVHMTVWIVSQPAPPLFDPLYLPQLFFNYAHGCFDMNDNSSGLALVIAAWNKKPELVHLLLVKGLRPIRCPSRFHIVQHLLDDGDSYELWRAKAYCLMQNHRGMDDKESVVEMFTNSADLASFNHLFDMGYAPDSACMTAAVGSEEQPLARMKRLVRAGATVNDREPGESTPLQLAISHQQDAIVRWLLRNDADVNLPPALANGRTALQAAAETGNLEILEILLSKKADVNAPPGQYAGGTALQLAAAQGYIGVVETLIKWGADVDAAAGENHGRTALEGAAENNRIDMVKCLLACGTMTTGEGRKQYIRAIKFAERHGHQACVIMLRNHRHWDDLDYAAYELEDLSEGSGLKMGQCMGCAEKGRHRMTLAQYFEKAPEGNEVSSTVPGTVNCVEGGSRVIDVADDDDVMWCSK